MKIKEDKGITKITIIIIIVMIIIILAVGIYYKSGQSLMPSEVEEGVLSLETNNGYKTFDFTVDEVMTLFKISDVISDNSNRPYCEKYSGTNCILFFTDNDYLADINIVYDQKSRKVISIDLSMSSMSMFTLTTEQGKNIETESLSVACNYFATMIATLLNSLSGEGAMEEFVAGYNNANKIENTINLKNTDIVCGSYFMLDNNTGYLQYDSDVGARARIIATNENDFYNLSINALTNLLMNDKLEKKSNHILSEKNKETDNDIKEQSTVKPIDEKQDIVYTLPNKSYPIINLSGSPEVENINARIKQNYAEDDEYCSSEYNYYLNNEILSIVITLYTPTSYYYEVYNINVNTGKVVSNTDLLKSKNIDETTFISKLKECCKSKFLEEHNKCPRNGKRTRIY